MRSPALKGWGDALLSFINPFASFRLERTGRNCSTLFYCQAFNETNFFISICLSSNLFLSKQSSQHSAFLEEGRTANTFGNKYEICEKLRKLNTSIRAKSEREPRSPCLGVHIFSKKSRRCPKIADAMKQIPYWGPTSIRRLPTKISCPGDPAPDIWTPRTWEACNKLHAKGQLLLKKKLQFLHTVKKLRTHLFSFTKPKIIYSMVLVMRCFDGHSNEVFWWS